MADHELASVHRPPATSPALSGAAGDGREAIFALERPDRRLLIYYVLLSMLFGPLFPILLIPLVLRFRTLRYRFDEEGIGMRWGALRRREVDLAYARIQDIHLISNAVERWLGLARIKVQTASGSQKAEVVIEGIPEFEALRSYLVDRMRQARRGGLGDGAASPAAGGVQGIDAAAVEALRASLESVTEELRAVRRMLAAAPDEPADEGMRSDHG